MGYTATWPPRGYQQITSLAAATNLTVPTGATRATIVAEVQAVRWRDDSTLAGGASPTATVGMPLAVGATLEFSGDLTKIQFIEQTASAKLNITYF